MGLVDAEVESYVYMYVFMIQKIIRSEHRDRVRHQHHYTRVK
jgi:hypothetical protein